MNSDKYSAVWVSYSSISDFLKCPRAYYLKNIYRDPESNHKINLINPPLSLGRVVHKVLESLSSLPQEKRFQENLIEKFHGLWKTVSGLQGGFFDEETENRYRLKGEKMIKRVIEHPDPLKNLAVKVQMDLPHYWLSPKDKIILCGKIDWLEYLPKTDSIHIIDFKTGKSEENQNSLQLPIYHLLVHNTQKRRVTKASYWYLSVNNQLSERSLPGLKESQEKVLKIAQKIKLARQLNHFKCPQRHQGCRFCQPLEKIIHGQAQKIGQDDYGADLYVLPQKRDNKKESVIL